MTEKEFRNTDNLRDELKQWINSPFGKVVLETLSQHALPAKISVPGLTGADYVTTIGTVQIFQTGWQESIRFLKRLTKPLSSGEPPQSEFQYLLPADAVVQPES